MGKMCGGLGGLMKKRIKGLVSIWITCLVILPFLHLATPHIAPDNSLEELQGLLPDIVLTMIQNASVIFSLLVWLFVVILFAAFYLLLRKHIPDNLRYEFPSFREMSLILPVVLFLYFGGLPIYVMSLLRDGFIPLSFFRVAPFDHLVSFFESGTSLQTAYLILWYVTYYIFGAIFIILNSYMLPSILVTLLKTVHWKNHLPCEKKENKDE